MTPDNIKYGHTPTGPEVIAGVTLKDAKRASKWPAYVDVAQSVTGAILGIFLPVLITMCAGFGVSPAVPTIALAVVVAGNYIAL